ncbi:MAG TPA: MarR family transcriptional regulator [Candidatus Pelethocola excrementipullorum]|nr:MarR family transcriptional regulator [Candidatus Pelethocola excrementipullorum]
MRQDIRVGFEVRTLDNMLMRNFASSVRSNGLDELTIMHGWIIGYLYENREMNIYQKDIEAYFSIGRSTVTNILKLMEKKGYLVREAVAHDARLKQLKLTQTGIKLHEDTQLLIAGLDQRTIEGISEEELDTFYLVIRKLKENLEVQRLERMNMREEQDD